jgi:hypothetical protein
MDRELPATRDGMGRAAASIVVQVDRRRLLDGWCGPVDVYTPSFGAGPIR